MSVSIQSCKHIYQADGQTRVWELDFPVLSATDVKILVTSADGTETAITTGYEVNLLQHTVTYPTLSSGLDALAPGNSITLLRATPLTQSINLTQQGVLDAEELERGYDKLTLQVQELNEQVDRSIKYAPSSGKTGADAAAFLAELQAAQTTALNGALASVEETKTALQQSLSDEQTARQNADSALQSAKQDVISDLSTIRSGAAAGATALQPATASSTYLSQTDAASTYLSKTDASSTYLSQTSAASTYVPLSQKAAANGLATLDSNTLIPSAQLPTATASTQGAVIVDGALNASSAHTVQNQVIVTRLSLLAPYIQCAAMRDFNEQTTVDASDLLAGTADLHSFSLDVSANNSLTKLTAKGTNATAYTGLQGITVSPSAPFNSATAPQIDVSYTGLDRAALVNLFNSMPYNVGYTAVGSPTITDGVVSAFSDSNYLQTSLGFPNSLALNGFVCQAKFTMPSAELTYSEYLLSTFFTSTADGLFITTSRRIQFTVGGAGLMSDPYVLELGGTYVARGVFTPTMKYIYLGPDEEHLVQVASGSVSTITPSTPRNTRIGRGAGDGNPFSGSIDLNKTYIQVGGVPWFCGTASVTKTVSVVGCTGTSSLTDDDKAIAEDKGWAITLS